MVEGAHMYPALTWLSDQQEWTLVNTGVRLKHHGEFVLSMMKGTEHLCLCSGCKIPTAVVSTWIQYRHCDEPLTRLISCEQEPLSYNVDLRSELCTLQPRKSQKASAGLKSSAQGRAESEPGDSPAKNGDIGGESWRSTMACSPVRDLAPVNTAQQEPEDTSEVLAMPVNPASPAFQKDSASSASGEW